MKAWEIIGWTYDGSMYHEECKPSRRAACPDVPHPIFASDEIEPFDYCDTCLHTFISENPGKKPIEWGTHVFLDSSRAEEEHSRRTEEDNANA
jgi:hypothetical protein